MKAILTFVVVQTGAILCLSAPILAYLEVPFWASPPLFGMLLIAGALAHDASTS